MKRIDTLISKNKLYQEQNGRCANPFCRKKVPLNEITIDHIKAKVRKGLDSQDNYQLLCKECNQDKGKKKQEHWLELQKAERMKAPKVSLL